jgi:hypothetical protein
MQEPETIPLPSLKGRVIGACGLKQAERPHYIRLDKSRRPPDAAINMGLCGEVYDRSRTMPAKQLQDQLLITDIASHEDMPWVFMQPVKVLEVPRVSKRVKIHHMLIADGEPIPDEIAADEACAPGDKDHDLPSRNDTLAELPIQTSKEPTGPSTGRTRPCRRGILTKRK